MEKEGFNELFEAAKRAERFGIAILGTKGMSVAANWLMRRLRSAEAMTMHARIAIASNVMQGQPVTRETRVTADLILRKPRAGTGGAETRAEEIVADRPRLGSHDLRAARAFAADDPADEEIVYQ